VKDSARYAKIVEWSEEDQCYVGSSPGLLYGGCHGDDEKAVFDELCRIVEDVIALYRSEGRPCRQPPPARTSRTRCSRWPERRPPALGDHINALPRPFGQRPGLLPVGAALWPRCRAIARKDALLPTHHGL